MVITDKFVYIHRPKTGGSFVTNALLKLYEGNWSLFYHAKLALLKEIHFKNKLGVCTINANKHGGCNEIPKKYLNRDIVSTIRNPYDYYVSQYEFGWWKRSNWLKYYRKVDGFGKRFASFPDLSFNEFMELMTAAFNEPLHKEFNNEQAAGLYTVEFIRDHFYEPPKVLRVLSADYVQSDAFRQDMYKVTFIFTHRLNQQLHDYLLQVGYPGDAIEFILKKDKVLPQGKGRTNEQKWERYYSPELKALVRKKDWLLFEIFPEFEQAG